MLVKEKKKSVTFWLEKSRQIVLFPEMLVELDSYSLSNSQAIIA